MPRLWCVLVLCAAVMTHAKKQVDDKGEGTERMLAEIDAATGDAEVAPPQSAEMAAHEIIAGFNKESAEVFKDQEAKGIRYKLLLRILLL